MIQLKATQRIKLGFGDKKDEWIEPGSFVYVEEKDIHRITYMCQHLGFAITKEVVPEKKEVSDDDTNKKTKTTQKTKKK